MVERNRRYYGPCVYEFRSACYLFNGRGSQCWECLGRDNYFGYIGHDIFIDRSSERHECTVDCLPHRYQHFFRFPVIPMGNPRNEQKHLLVHGPIQYRDQHRHLDWWHLHCLEHHQRQHQRYYHIEDTNPNRHRKNLH